MTAPLILTLAMDEASQERFERLRRAFFPPERNLVPAHLTLFHSPSARRPRPRGRCNRRRGLPAAGAYDLEGVGPAFYGTGCRLQARLVGARSPAKTAGRKMGAQDHQDFRLHVTVQNKVTKEKAHALHHRLQSSCSPFEVAGEGLSLWRYLGRPWQPVGTYPFLGRRSVRRPASAQFS